MNKEKNAILTQNAKKSHAPLVIGIVIVLAAVAAYFIWLRPSSDAEADASESSQAAEETYKSYEDCLMKLHSAKSCTKYLK